MHTLLGLVGLVIFVLSVIGLSAAVTALVVRISPSETKKPQQTG